ncbi:DUF986 family protein [Orbaceae bacterium ac157xtp]
MNLITIIILIITNLSVLFLIIYDKFIIPNRFGKTLLTVELRNQKRIIGLFFIGIFALLLYQNWENSVDYFTDSLLVLLLILSIYIYLLRKPQFIMKKEGFIFSAIFIPYSRIKNINLTDKGSLVIQLDVKPILIHPRKLEDLEKICKTLLETTYKE